MVMQVAAMDLDYLAARLHGRRSRLAEGGRLDPLCRLTSLSEFGRAVWAGAEVQGAAAVQRRLVRELTLEWAAILRQLDGAAAEWFAWLLVRFQIENLKVLARGVASRTPWERVQPHLVAPPRDLALDTAALMAAASLDEFAGLLPAGQRVRWWRERFGHEHSRHALFLLETALDGDYFQELLARTGRLPEAERELIRPLVRQEVDGFQVMLAVRGHVHDHVPAEALAPLRVRGSGISAARFAALLAAPDVAAVAGLAVGYAIDVMPSGGESHETGIEPAVLEALVWNRFWRLANRVFRRSHLGFGVVAGYAGLRRMEVANLITLSEGIRLGTPAAARRARMTPRVHVEAMDV